MKRIIVLFLAFCITLSFAACSQKKPAPETTTAKETTAAQTTEAQADENSPTEAKTTENVLPEIEKGKVTGNVYENKSLGFKITPPEEWEHFEDKELTKDGNLSGDPNEVYNATVWNETDTGYEYKSVSVSISDDSSFKSIDDYIKYLETNFNDEPEYMKTEKRKPMKIGNREYRHIAFVYPNSKDIHNDVFICFDRGKLVSINFLQLDEKEIKEFIDKYFQKK